MLYQEYIFGDTAVRYIQTPDLGVGLSLLPADLPVEDVDALCCDSMVQAALRRARTSRPATSTVSSSRRRQAS